MDHSPSSDSAIKAQNQTFILRGDFKTLAVARTQSASGSVTVSNGPRDRNNSAGSHSPSLFCMPAVLPQMLGIWGCGPVGGRLGKSGESQRTRLVGNFSGLGGLIRKVDAMDGGKRYRAAPYGIPSGSMLNWPGLRDPADSRQDGPATARNQSHPIFGRLGRLGLRSAFSATQAEARQCPERRREAGRPGTIDVERF
jgi:hypothetical protein